MSDISSATMKVIRRQKEILYVSYARGKFRPDSDTDILSDIRLSCRRCERTTGNSERSSEYCRKIFEFNDIKAARFTLSLIKRAVFLNADNYKFGINN